MGRHCIPSAPYRWNPTFPHLSFIVLFILVPSYFGWTILHVAPHDLVFYHICVVLFILFVVRSSSLWVCVSRFLTPICCCISLHLRWSTFPPSHFLTFAPLTFSFPSFIHFIRLMNLRWWAICCCYLPRSPFYIPIHCCSYILHLSLSLLVFVDWNIIYSHSHTFCCSLESIIYLILHCAPHVVVTLGLFVPFVVVIYSFYHSPILTCYLGHYLWSLLTFVIPSPFCCVVPPLHIYCWPYHVAPSGGKWSIYGDPPLWAHGIPIWGFPFAPWAWRRWVGGEDHLICPTTPSPPLLTSLLVLFIPLSLVLSPFIIYIPLPIYIPLIYLPLVVVPPFSPYLILQILLPLGGVNIVDPISHSSWGVLPLIWIRSFVVVTFLTTHIVFTHTLLYWRYYLYHTHLFSFCLHSPFIPLIVVISFCLRFILRVPTPHLPLFPTLTPIYLLHLLLPFGTLSPPSLTPIFLYLTLLHICCLFITFTHILPFHFTLFYIIIRRSGRSFVSLFVSFGCCLFHSLPFILRSFHFTLFPVIYILLLTFIVVCALFRSPRCCCILTFIIVVVHLTPRDFCICCWYLVNRWTGGVLVVVVLFICYFIVIYDPSFIPLCPSWWSLAPSTRYLYSHTFLAFCICPVRASQPVLLWLSFPCPCLCPFLSFPLPFCLLLLPLTSSHLPLHIPLFGP